MTKKKIALFFPYFIKGGSDIVVANTIESLKEKYNISLFTYDTYEKISNFNNFFGTKILKDDITIINPPFSFFWRKIFGFGLLKYHLLVRYFKKYYIGKFDILLGMYKEIDFGKNGIQYIHVPELDKEDQELNNSPIKYYKNSFLGNTYKNICYLISGFNKERMSNNITLVNSNWTKNIVERTLRVKAQVVYPPVLDNLSVVLQDNKEDNFLCLGRVVVEKEIEKVVRIIKRVRENGFNINLYIVGEADKIPYKKSIEELCKNVGNWCFFKGLVEGKDKLQIMSICKYGISGCTNEAFGIATAEMTKAGCIVFVPQGGGQAEIVNHQDLIYKDENDAVQKIIAVIRDKNLQINLKNHLLDLSRKFSADNFKINIIKIVNDLEYEVIKAS